MVAEFDEAEGYGTVEDADGHALLLPLHADRRRHPDDPVGADVEFDVGAGRQGRWEAMGLRP